MALIVQKFGGSSVRDRERIFNVARIVAQTHNAGNDVVVVVSAQGDTTDDLIAKAAEITHNPSAREMDMLLASGEQISIALLAMALNEIGCHATSLTGWQAGFHTDRAYTKARIKRMDVERITSELERNRIVVVAGFQGINKLDGYEALYYVRERYAFVNGDYQRGINQMQVIQAVAEKAMSPVMLTNFTSLMDAVDDCFKTSIPTDLITALVRDQLANGGDWNIVTYYVSGTGSSEYTYSIPSQKAYVTIPDESTVEMAKDLMQQVRDGKIIEDPNAEASDAPSY
jgi:hypothetical protein